MMSSARYRPVAYRRYPVRSRTVRVRHHGRASWTDTWADTWTGPNNRGRGIRRDRMAEQTSSSIVVDAPPSAVMDVIARSEEHTSELQSLMRLSYAVFYLK